MGKHNSNGMRKVLKQLRKLGVDAEKKASGFFLTHTDVDEGYLMHYGERAIHPVRRWVKKHFGVDIKF